MPHVLMTQLLSTAARPPPRSRGLTRASARTSPHCAQRSRIPSYILSQWTLSSTNVDPSADSHPQMSPWTETPTGSCRLQICGLTPADT
eukprot:1177120-Prorocentrum_minimum.AAC.1